jgi:hypothetical protein
VNIEKIIELGFAMAKSWRSDDDEGAIRDWYEQTIRPLDDRELSLVHFACKMLLGEKPFLLSTDDDIDPRFYEIAKMLGAHATPCPNSWVDDLLPGNVSVLFVPRGLAGRAA